MFFLLTYSNKYRKIILIVKYFNEFPTEILVLTSLELKKGVKTFSQYVMSFSLCQPILAQTLPY